MSFGNIAWNPNEIVWHEHDTWGLKLFKPCMEIPLIEKGKTPSKHQDQLLIAYYNSLAHQRPLTHDEQEARNESLQRQYLRLLEKYREITNEGIIKCR